MNQSYFFISNCRKNKTWQQRMKKFHVTQHVGDFSEREQICQIIRMHFHDIYFIVFMLCLRYREMNVCLLCLIFVNSFYKNTWSIGWWKLTTIHVKKKELWIYKRDTKKMYKKSLWGIVGSHDINTQQQTKFIQKKKSN